MANVSYQVPRHSFYWLLLAALFAVLPHAFYGGLWLKVLLPLVLLWRCRIHVGRAEMPNKWLRFLLMAVVLALVWRENGHFFGTEASSQLLVGAFLLKLLEMQRQRDAYVFLVLGYFVAATVFLFYQGPFTAFYVLLLLWLLTAALVGVNVPTLSWSGRSHGRSSAVILLQSIPIMVVLFIFVPRFGPLWAIPSSEGKAKTGMTDSLTLGAISELSESTELAFRVEFEEARPPQSALYWRGLVLSEFDGRQWRQPHRIKHRLLLPERQSMPVWWQQLTQREVAAQYTYRVLLEPTGESWLYGLSHSASQTPQVGLAFGDTLARARPVDERFVYEAQRAKPKEVPEALTEKQRDHYVHLPPLVEPKTRQLAAQLMARHSTADALVEGALQWFLEEPFSYTLTPPRTGEHPNDDFLFGTQSGFCEHFASAFAVLMRAAKVPARVVVGYQGGEWNPRSQHLSVYQYHAHAWVEVWLPERGWVRVDPTATVAPERIEQARTAAQSSNSAVRAMWYGNRLISSLRAQLDWIEFNWQRWVLNYDESQQNRFLSGLLGHITPAKLAYSLAVLVFILLLPVLVWTFWQTRGPQRTHYQEEFHWLRLLLHRKARVPMEATAHLSPQQLANMASLYWPEAAHEFEQWAAAMVPWLYAPEAPPSVPEDLKRIRKTLAKLPKSKAELP